MIPSVDPPQSKTRFTIGWLLLGIGLGALVVLLVNLSTFSAAGKWVGIIFIVVFIGCGTYVLQHARGKVGRHR